jgi:hypothetical protein
MKAEAEQKKTLSKLALRKAEEQTKQAEQQMEQVLAHITVDPTSGEFQLLFPQFIGLM